MTTFHMIGSYDCGSVVATSFNFELGASAKLWMELIAKDYLHLNVAAGEHLQSCVLAFDGTILIQDALPMLDELLAGVDEYLPLAVKDRQAIVSALKSTDSDAISESEAKNALENLWGTSRTSFEVAEELENHAAELLEGFDCVNQFPEFDHKAFMIFCAARIIRNIK